MNDWEAGASGAVVTEDFDVFLNHRGPDVKATFVAHLEDALRCAGHRPFLDARSLMKGNPALQSIDHALDVAKVHVAVVSRGYAQSKYCLNELVAIVRSGKPVVPVFYGVEPVDLRWVESGPFAEAFERHQSKGRSQKKVQEWREALAAVAGITGFRLADYRSDESKLKQEVVNQVARLTPSHIPVEVDSCRVGLEGPASSCIEVLEEMNAGKSILGLVGMSGIGKTTLAREIYNYFAVQTKFRRMSFLEIHRDYPASTSNVQARPTWSRKLRKQLLWDLLRVETSWSTDYSNWFWKVSTLGPVMIVVDDVHNLDQFEAVIPCAANLHPGSSIIVTSRDRSILNIVAGRARVDHYIFHVDLLDSQDSSVLFNWHAFHSKEAPEDFRELAIDIVKACGGLPLALKVIGSSLFDKRSGRDRETIWIEAGDAMRHSKDVMDVLRWSYDILPRAEQHMFVDITCLFVNESVEGALSYWKSCKDCVSCGGMSTPHTSLRNLIDKNLVLCKACSNFKVHDLLVELGKEIGKLAKTHSTQGNIGEAAFTRKEESTNMMALSLRESKKRKFEVEEFANMPHLHFLELPKGAMMDGDWRCMSKELRWLRWRNTFLTHIPSDLNLSHLTSLDFSESSTLVALWSKQDWNLKGCHNLVCLNLSKCSSITILPNSIGQFSELRVLKLESCTKLKKLPESVGQLKQLQHLHLKKCRTLKALPNSIGQASRLQTLNISGCMKLVRLPESIGLLKELKDLYMAFCTSLKTLPDSIGGLSSLKTLDGFDCTSLTTVPPSIQLCSSLCFLWLQPSVDCQVFLASTIGEAWTKLESLALLNFNGVTSPLDYGSLTSLIQLVVEDKIVTEFSESIGLLVRLSSFTIACERLQCLPNSLGDIKSLKVLALRHCDNLKRLPKNLAGLTNLEKLSFSDCGLLRKLPSSIGLLSRLKSLSIERCKKMQKLSTSFTQLKNLGSFWLFKCGSIVAMEALTTLQGMPIWGSTPLTKLPHSLGVLSNLHIECSDRRNSSWIRKPFNGTCQVLEEDESSFLKAYHDESTGLLSVKRWTYKKVRCINSGYRLSLQEEK